jgi:acetylornithine deacetylase
MQTIHQSGIPVFGSSTLSDMALIPFPAVKMGPGASARSHTAGEYILVSEIEEAVTGYCAFLETLGASASNKKDQQHETLG